MPILKKPNPTQTTAKAPAKPVVQNDPFAAKYAETDAAKGKGFVPPEPGSYNAIIVEGQYQRDGDETKAYLEVQIVDEGVNAGKNCRIYYNFTDKDGKEEPGMPYFKSNMQMLGREDDFLSEDDCAEFLAQLAEQQVWIEINVSKKGQWTNIYLNSVPENQDDKPALINS